MLGQCRAATTLPAAGLDHEECLERGSNLVRAAGNLEADFAVLTQPVTLPPDLLQLLAAERLPQQALAVLGGVQDSAWIGVKNARVRAAARRGLAERLQRGAF